MSNLHRSGPGDQSPPPHPPATQPPDVADVVGPVAEAFAERLIEAVEHRLTRHQIPSIDHPLYDIKAVARKLAISVRTVETLVAEGRIVPVAVRGQRRFTPESVDAYIRHSVRSTGSRRGR